MTVEIAALGLKVDSTQVEQADKSLDKLASTGARVEQAAQRMGASFGKAARDVELQVSRMLNETQAWQKQQDQLNRSFVETTRVAAPAGKAADDFSRKLKQTGTTAEQTARQMRMVAPQITDVVTQLSAGANPLQVFIQQGGQLKDVFGGIGPAARAVGGYVAGLVSPFTVAAAAVAVLGVAYYQGAQEAKEYTKAIVLSGNAAGTTAGQLQQAAKNVSAVVGTQGKAAEVIAMLTATGKVANDQLQTYTEMAVRLDRLGVEAKDTVADLAALGKDPLQATQKLNESLNFLTGATYTQIKALTDLGQTDAAAEAAQNAYAQAMDSRARLLESQLGTVERAWVKVKDAAKFAWDAMLNVGRPVTLEDQLATIQQQIDKARGTFDPSAFSGNANLRAQLPDLKEQERRLQRMLEITNGNAAAQAQVVDRTKATVEFDKLAEQSLSRQEKIARDVAKARELGAKAGASQAEIDKVIAGIAYEASKLGIEAQIERLQGLQQVLEVRTKGVLADLDAQRRMGAMNERLYVEEVAAAELAAMSQHRAILEQQMMLKAKERDSDKEVAAIQREIALLDAQKSERQKQLNRDIAVMNDQLEKTRTLAKMELQQEFSDSWGRAIQQNSDAFSAAGMRIYEYQRSLQDSSKELDFQTNLLGRTTQAQALLNEQHRIDLELLRQLRAIDDDKDLDPAQKQVLRERASRAATEAAAQASTAVWVREWDAANKEIGEGLYDVLTGQGQSAAQRLERLFADLVLRPIIQPIANYATNLLMGGAPTSAGTGSGLMNNMSSLSNLLGGGAGWGNTLANGASALGFGNFAAGLSGAGGSFASTVGAGLATDAMGATVAEGAAAATLGSTGAAAGSAVAAAIPVIGWVVAIGALLYSILGKKGGGPKTEGYYNPYNSDAYYSSNNGEVAASAMKGAAAIQAQYNALAQIYGANPSVQFGLGYSMDPRGRADSQAHIGLGRDGATLMNLVDTHAGRSQEDLQNAIATLTSRAILAGLQQSNIGGVIGSYLASLGNVASLAADEVAAAIARVQKAAQEKQTLEDRWFELTHTQQEVLDRNRQRELDALDLSNRQLQVRINYLQDEIAAQQQAQAVMTQLSSAIDDMKDRVDEFLNKLNATPAGLLSPGEQLANARQQFDAQLALAKTGNGAALQGITGYADQLISAQIAYSASGQPTQETLAYVKDQLAALQQLTPQQAAPDAAAQAQQTTAQLIAAAEAKAAAQIAALQQQIEAQQAADQAAAAARAAAAAAAAAKPKNDMEGWVVDENGYRWVGAGPQPGPQPLIDWQGRDMRSYAADGAVFTNTVVRRPTDFMSATGEAWRMGEAGDEGVVPLIRTRSGALGVRSEGGASGALVAEVRALRATMDRILMVTAAAGRGTVAGLAEVADNTKAAARAVALKAAEARV